MVNAERQFVKAAFKSKEEETKTKQRTHVCHFVLCADDSILGEFTELNVVFIHKRAPEEQTTT